MPGGDRTGPMGQGPMTGRGAGYCAGTGAGGYANAGFGRRFAGYRCGFGQGGGRGWRHRFYATGMPGWVRAGYGVAPMSAPFTKEQEVDLLKAQSSELQQELEQINQRLSELESK